MIEKAFEQFKELLARRCDKLSLLNIGEDSIRYDFFTAILKELKLQPWEIFIEYPIDIKSFEKRENKESKRNEKPLMDLVINNDELKICVEFALFRQNSNEEGSINKTARTVKMLNDLIRLGIDSYNTKRKAYFICVADDKMLGHQLQSKIIGPFPSNYEITWDIVNKQMLSKTSAFDQRFINVFKKMNTSFKANIIFNEDIEFKNKNRKTKLIIWEINKS